MLPPIPTYALLRPHPGHRFYEGMDADSFLALSECEHAARCVDCGIAIAHKLRGIKVGVGAGDLRWILYQHFPHNSLPWYTMRFGLHDIQKKKSPKLCELRMEAVAAANKAEEAALAAFKCCGHALHAHAAAAVQSVDPPVVVNCPQPPIGPATVPNASHIQAR